MEKEKLKQALEQAVKITEKNIPFFEGGFPAPASEANWYTKIENNDWTAGFYTGILWICYELTGKRVFLDTVQEHIKSFRYRIEKRVMVDHP